MSCFCWLGCWTVRNEKKESEGITKDLITKIAPWKFGRKKPDAIPRSSSMKSIKLGKSSSFWKKQANEQGRTVHKANSEPRKRLRRAKQNATEVAEVENAEREFTYKKSAPVHLDPAAISTKPRNSNMAELDEYSVHEAVSDDPALVQCLKFYSCGTLADKVNAAIQATSCPGAFVDQEEDTGDATDGYFMPGTPEPAVEVVLDNLLHQHEQRLGAKGSHKSVSSRHSLLSCGDTNSWDEAIKTPTSYLLEVTDKRLRLDGDFFLTRQRQQPVRKSYGDESSIALNRADFSVTSVRIPQIQKQKKNSAKKIEKESKMTVRKQFVHEIEKSESTDREEESQTGYTSNHDIELEESKSYRPEYNLKGGGTTGRLQKLVSRLRKK